MKASDAVIDKEAEQEQLEQVSKQMEDAILKEKQAQDLKRASKSNLTWEASSESMLRPDERFPQPKWWELDNIEKEQMKLLEQEVESLPGGSETLRTANTKTADELIVTESSHDKVVDKVLDSMTKTKEVLKEVFPDVHNIGHKAKETTKTSMDALKDVAKSSMTSISQKLR